jgi:hypothetical protein
MKLFVAHRLWASSCQHFSRTTRSCISQLWSLAQAPDRLCLPRCRRLAFAKPLCPAYHRVTRLWDGKLELASPNAERHLCLRFAVPVYILHCRCTRFTGLPGWTPCHRTAHIPSAIPSNKRRKTTRPPGSQGTTHVCKVASFRNRKKATAGTFAE